MKELGVSNLCQGLMFLRSTINQVEKYNQATNTVFGKYRALPGVKSYSKAAHFGLALGSNEYVRCLAAGHGDENGQFEGIT
jgi:hypothetical protein